MDPGREDYERSPVIDALRRRIESRDLRGLEVTYEIVPGLRRDRGANRLVLRPGGRSLLVRASPVAAGRISPAEMALPVDDKEIESLLTSLTAVIEELAPRQRAAFLPDSEVVMITVTVDGRREDFFYLANPEDRRIQHKPISEHALRALENFKRMVKPSPTGSD